MHAVDIFQNKKKHSFFLPENWDEVPGSCWADISMPILIGDSPQSRVQLLKAMLAKQNGSRIHIRLFKALDPVQIKSLANTLGWVWEYQMIKRPFKSFSIDGKTFLLPGDQLENAVLIEYAYCDLFYNLYAGTAGKDQQEAAEEYLDKLISYMCRPRNPKVNDRDAESFEGDYREKFNTSLCDARLPLIKKLAPEKKLAILLFFIGCKTAIHETYQGTIFHKESGNGDQVIGAREIKPQEWIDMAFHLAGGKFGDLEKTMFTNIYTIFHHLALQEKMK